MLIDFIIYLYLIIISRESIEAESYNRIEAIMLYWIHLLELLTTRIMTRINIS